MRGLPDTSVPLQLTVLYNSLELSWTVFPVLELGAVLAEKQHDLFC